MPHDVPAALAANSIPKYSPGMSKIQLGEYVLNQLFTTSYDSDTLLRRLGITRAHLRTLEADDEISQCKNTHRDAVVGTAWRLEPNQSRSAKKITAILEPWCTSLVSMGNESISYGYSVIQISWRKTPNGVSIGSAFQCPLEWFKPTYDGDLIASTTIYWENGGGIAAQQGESVLTKYPGLYFHVVRDGSYTNPCGEAILARLYLPATWRRQGWGIWLGYLETFAQPIIIGQTLDFNNFVEAMKAQGIRSVVGYQTDEQSKITTISGAQAGEFERLEKNLTHRIQKLYLGQTFSSGLDGNTGSYAAGQTLELVRQDKKISAIRLITPFMQKICDTIADLNGLSRCKFVMADDTGLETFRTERDAKLLPVIMASGLKLTRDYFIDRYDYSDTDIVPVSSPGSSPISPDQEPQLSSSSMEDISTSTTLALNPGTPNQYQKMIDRFVSAGVESENKPLPDTDLQAAIGTSGSLQELGAKLKDIILQSSDDFENGLYNAHGMSRVVGYVASEKGDR